VILAGEAAPGTFIPLDAVAQFFAVSVIPVRESLKTLIGEGLVDHVPRGDVPDTTTSSSQSRALSTLALRG